jgi:hypothetical protein
MTGVQQALKQLNPQLQNILVGTALSFSSGQIFSLIQMHAAVNTYFEQLKIDRLDMSLLCSLGQSLVEAGLLNTTAGGDRRLQRPDLQQLNAAQVCQHNPLMLYILSSM